MTLKKKLLRLRHIQTELAGLEVEQKTLGLSLFDHELAPMNSRWGEYLVFIEDDLSATIEIDHPSGAHPTANNIRNVRVIFTKCVSAK